MTKWIYVPRVHAYVDARDIISQSLDTKIGRDIITNLEVSKAFVKEHPEQMQGDSNVLMDACEALGL